MAGYSLRLAVRASIRSGISGAARLPAMPENNSFRVNGLCERKREGSTSFWPLAGTGVPIPDTAKNEWLAPRGKPLLRTSLHSRREARDHGLLVVCLLEPRRERLLQHRLRPVFQGFFHLVQELVGHRAVHHAMVVAERHVAHRADGDRVVDDHRALLDGAETEDADVRLADHRQPEQAAEDAWVGDGERTFLHLFGLQFFRTRALREVIHVALDAENVFLVGVFHHRDEQAPIEGHGDADVDLLVQDDVRSVQRGVQRRKRAQAGDGGLHEEGHERQLGLVALFELVLGLRSQGSYLGHVDFVDGVHVRGNTLRRHHVLGDALPHGAHRLHFVIAEVHLFARHCRFERYVYLPAGDPRRGCGWRWWRRGPRRRRRSRSGVSRRRSSRRAAARDHRLDVLLADSTTRSGASHGREIDAMLRGHAPDQRRTVNPLAG